MLELHFYKNGLPFLVNPDEISQVSVKDSQVTITMRCGREILIEENYLTVADKVATHDVPNILRIIGAVIEVHAKASRTNTRQLCNQLEMCFKKLDSLFDALSSINGKLTNRGI